MWLYEAESNYKARNLCLSLQFIRSTSNLADVLLETQGRAVLKLVQFGHAGVPVLQAKQ